MSSKQSHIVNVAMGSIIVLGIISVVLSAAVAPALAAQETTSSNETATETVTATQTTTATDTATATETPTATEVACEPGDDEPEMDQARLHASDQTIETGSPGRISGGFQVDPTSNCPVVVYVTMSVPSGMSISGGSDFTSGGAGMVSSRFTVEPGANIKDLSAEVYSEETGQLTVTANIQYWPEGHQDMSREIDGLSFSFTAEDATTPSSQATSQDGDSENDSGFPVSVNVLIIGALLLIVALAVGALS